MEGAVLSFLKAEWKVSDTGSAHLYCLSFTKVLQACLLLLQQFGHTIIERAIDLFVLRLFYQKISMYNCSYIWNFGNSFVIAYYYKDLHILWQFDKTSFEGVIALFWLRNSSSKSLYTEFLLHFINVNFLCQKKHLVDIDLSFLTGFLFWQDSLYVRNHGFECYWSQWSKKKNVHFLFFLIDTNKFIYLDNVRMICHF